MLVNMRTLLVITFLFFATILNGQSFWPGSFTGNSYRGNFRNLNAKDSTFNKKWSVSKYSGIATSFTAWKGGFASIISAPVGLQLNRTINNNVFAFAGVSAAPSYVNFRQSFINTDFSKATANAPFYKANNLRLYSRAEIGLSYINDERTFQISGSIGVERNNFPSPLLLPGTYSNNNNPSAFK
jgi:hypothetical protein